MRLKIISYFYIIVGSILSLERDLVRHYDGYTVLRLTPTSRQQIEYLRHLREIYDEYDGEINFWTYSSDINASVDVMVSPKASQEFRDALNENKIKKISTIIVNVESLIRAGNRIHIPRAGFSGLEFWFNYRRLLEIELFLRSLRKIYPSVVTLYSIGRSFEGRKIVMIKIGIKRPKTLKPAIFIDSAIHAREWISPATTTFLIQQLVDGYRLNNPEIKNLLATYDWMIVPVLNPDGYAYSHTRDRFWRKNRSHRNDSSCYGVDLNRNFDHQWMTVGASNNSCSQMYAGLYPNSEPETRALSKYIMRNANRIKIYLNIHSYSQLWMYPWGWTQQLTKDDNDLREKANIAVKALSQLYGTNYRVGSISNTIYLASGTSVDWVYASGIKYSYAVELRDTGEYGFLLPANQIIPTANETTAAILALVNAVSIEIFD